MANLFKLITDIAYLEDDELIDYFENFFDIDNLAQYTFDDLSNKKEKESAKKMFGEGDIFNRAKDILDEDPYCLEAFFVFYRMSDDYNLYLYFDKMFSNLNKYNKLSKYKKFAYKQIMDNFVAFLTEINSPTQAISVQMRLIDKLQICGQAEIIRLSFLFAMKEDFEDLYDLYLKVGFFDESSYICLITTALKNNEEIKAIEVLNDFLEEYKYADYIDHPWDLEKIEDNEAIRMNEAMNACFEFVRSIPYFMPWCKENKGQSAKA